MQPAAGVSRQALNTGWRQSATWRGQQLLRVTAAAYYSPRSCPAAAASQRAVKGGREVVWALHACLGLTWALQAPAPTHSAVPALLASVDGRSRRAHACMHIVPVGVCTTLVHNHTGAQPPPTYFRQVASAGSSRARRSLPAGLSLAGRATRHTAPHPDECGTRMQRRIPTDRPTGPLHTYRCAYLGRQVGRWVGR